jgi:predicted RNA-binding protein with PIN domain
MRWLIDGYNVIRRDPDLRGAEAAGLEAGRRALLAVLAPVVRRTADRFTVVFDGAPTHAPAAGRGQLEVLFSRPPDKADDVVIRLARQDGAGAVVVSSDRVVRDAARRAGCAVLGADEFLAGLDEGAGDTDDDEDDPAPSSGGKRGNPQRLSRDARAAQRALRRLRGPGRP